MENNLFTNSMKIAHSMCINKLKTGDIAVDATMGNGNDTIFLGSLVGPAGKIYSFDIQKKALEATRKKVAQKCFSERIVLINDGHENMDKYIKEKVKLVIFNLGYLPGGDHNITTKAETTLSALKKAINLIEINGLILLVVYPGHPEGKIEKDILLKYTSALDQKKYNVFKLCFINEVNNPPMLIAIEKRICL